MHFSSSIHRHLLSRHDVPDRFTRQWDAIREVTRVSLLSHLLGFDGVGDVPERLFSLCIILLRCPASSAHAEYYPESLSPLGREVSRWLRALSFASEERLIIRPIPLGGWVSGSLYSNATSLFHHETMTSTVPALFYASQDCDRSRYL